MRRRLAWGTGGLLAVLLVVGLGVARCAGGSGDDALPHGEKQPRPVAFSGKPLWDERKLGMTAAAGIVFRGDAAVVAGDVGSSGARLAVADVRTGALRWLVDNGYPLRGGDGAVVRREDGYQAEHLRGPGGEPVTYGTGDDWTVLVQYAKGAKGSETELGVAALSGKDGSVRWKHPLVRPSASDKGDADRERTVRLLGAGPRAVLASVEGEDGLDPETTALDPASGRELWRHEDGWAYRTAGDTVLGETRGDKALSSNLFQDRRDGAAVFALDAATGRQRWILGDAPGGSAHLEAVAGGTAVVKVRERREGRTSPQDRSMLVDVATGRPTKDSARIESGGDAPGLFSCADDGRLIACSALHGRLVTIRPGKHGEAVATEKRPFGDTSFTRVEAVWQDRIFVGSSDGPRFAVVDRAANRLGAAPPGETAAVSERAAAFRVRRDGQASSTPDGIAVHAAAVGAEPSEPARTDPPAIAPPHVDAAPLWTAGAGRTPAPGAAVDTGLTSLIGIDLAGDAVVYTGRVREEEDDATKLVVADAATGKTRWSARTGTSLGGGDKADYLAVPQLVQDGGEQLLLVRYVSSGDAPGVAALALKDGAVRWKKRITGDGSVFVKAAGKSRFAVDMTDYDAPAKDRGRMAVFDTGTRRELWHKSGVTSAGAAGDPVFGARIEQQKDWTRKHLDLIAYRASDGKESWRLGDRYREPELLYDEGGSAIVVGTAEGGVVLDRATGRELGRTGAPLTRCDGDGDALVVCQAGLGSGSDADAHGYAVTVRTSGGATTIRHLPETTPLTRYGAVGNWFTAVRPARTQGRGEVFLAFDGEGRQLTAGLPGRPMEIGGGFAVVARPGGDAPGTGPSGFAVHRVPG